MNVIFTPGLVTPFDGTFNLIYSKLLAAEHFKWTKWKEEEEAETVAVTTDACVRAREKLRRRIKHYRVVEWNCFFEFNSFAFICFLTDSPNLFRCSLVMAMMYINFEIFHEEKSKRPKKMQILSITIFFFLIWRISSVCHSNFSSNSLYNCYSFIHLIFKCSGIEMHTTFSQSIHLKRALGCLVLSIKSELTSWFCSLLPCRTEYKPSKSRTY